MTEKFDKGKGARRQSGKQSVTSDALVLPPLTIYSGGQTGADMAGLEAADVLRLPIAGHCPRGRINEAGVIPEKYPLTETRSADYQVRTKLNVGESDGTIIVHSGAFSRGTRLTIKTAESLGKPIFKFNINEPPPIAEFVEWLENNDIKRLNVAGPRGSKEPNLQEKAKELLIEYIGYAVRSRVRSAGGAGRVEE